MGRRCTIPVLAATLSLGGTHLGFVLPHDLTAAVTCVPFDSVFAPYRSLRLVSHESALLASIADIAMSGNGNLVIADNIDANVKLYDQTGRWVRTLGQLGDGPGEFRQPKAVAVRHDSVFVLDTHHPRLSLFSIDGPFLKSIPIRVIGPSGLGITGGSQLLIAGHGRIDEPSTPDILPTLHVIDMAGRVRRSYRPGRRRERLYEANFSEALLNVRGMRAILGDRTSNVVRIVNVVSDSTHLVTLTPEGYEPPQWPRRRFSGQGGEQLRKLTDWANAQSWLLGVWYVEPGFVLGRFSNPTERHKGRYALAALDSGPAPLPICASSSKVAAVVDGRDVITYQEVQDTTDLHVRQIRIVG